MLDLAVGNGVQGRVIRRQPGSVEMATMLETATGTNAKANLKIESVRVSLMMILAIE
jgi:hypothetical protein